MTPDPMAATTARRPLIRRARAWLAQFARDMTEVRDEMLLGLVSRTEIMAARSVMYQLGWHVEGNDLADDVRALANAWMAAEVRADMAIEAHRHCADPASVLVVRLEWHLLEHGLWCDECALPGRYRLALVNRSTLARWQTVSACDGCGARAVEA